MATAAAAYPTAVVGGDVPAAASTNLHSRTVLVTSIPTQVITVPASTRHAQLQVVVIPGNPGTASFYTAFMLMLHERFSGQATVLAVSHAGHEEGSPADKAWTLECQVQHKLDFLLQHVLLPGRPPAVLVCHSIGSYMMLHALQRLEDVRGVEPGAPEVVKVG